MNARTEPHRSATGAVIYGVLNPIPFGFFVGAWVFDAIYLRSGFVMWGKSAAWLITLGLVFAIVPRLINLVQVWITSRRFSTKFDRLDFWLNLIAIVVAIVNAFVHTRDAYGSMPEGVWLSAVTVLLLGVGHGIIAVRDSRRTYGYE